MIIVFKKKVIIALILIICCVVQLIVTTKITLANNQVAQNNSKMQFIIDAGHGGDDPGTSSQTGIKEKALNLDIALKVGNLLKLYGFEVLYTRESDTSLDTGEKFNKREDILKRIEMVNSSSNSILLSIHMNSFPQKQYSGAQIFHNDSDIAKNIATKIQTDISENLDTNNTRQVKKVPKTALLFSKSNKPSVLCECGFLSNEAEAKKLSDNEYRTKLAITIVNSIISQV